MIKEIRTDPNFRNIAYAITHTDVNIDYYSVELIRVMKNFKPLM